MQISQTKLMRRDQKLFIFSVENDLVRADRLF